MQGTNYYLQANHEIVNGKNWILYGVESTEPSAVSKFICKWVFILAASYFAAHIIVFLIRIGGLIK